MTLQLLHMFLLPYIAVGSPQLILHLPDDLRPYLQWCLDLLNVLGRVSAAILHSSEQPHNIGAVVICLATPDLLPLPEWDHLLLHLLPKQQHLNPRLVQLQLRKKGFSTASSQAILPAHRSSTILAYNIRCQCGHILC